MRIVYSVEELDPYVEDLLGSISVGDADTRSLPLLIDRFLESATEIDVDAIFDGTDMYVGGVMEHVEAAGIHSGDSACVVPPPTLSAEAHERVLYYTQQLAAGLHVRGMINIQFAVKGDDVYVLEANPRASRTVPFISKATGVSLAKVATRVMMGESIADMRAIGLLPKDGPPDRNFVAVKEAVLPWERFPLEDVVLGPEMRATGEVMGIGPDMGIAYGKALLAAGHRLPGTGTLFLSLADKDKPEGVHLARMFSNLGFRIFATYGTAGHLARNELASTHVDKVGEGPFDPVRLLEAGEIDLVINTPQGRQAQGDGRLIRRAAIKHSVPCVTTLEGGLAVARSIKAGPDAVRRVASLQKYHED